MTINDYKNQLIKERPNGAVLLFTGLWTPRNKPLLGLFNGAGNSVEGGIFIVDNLDI
jgi:hypothetical protein